MVWIYPFRWENEGLVRDPRINLYVLFYVILVVTVAGWVVDRKFQSTSMVNLRLDLQIKIVFIGSMYGIFTYMYHKNLWNGGILLLCWRKAKFQLQEAKLVYGEGSQTVQLTVGSRKPEITKTYW